MKTASLIVSTLCIFFGYVISSTLARHVGWKVSSVSGGDIIPCVVANVCFTIENLNSTNTTQFGMLLKFVNSVASNLSRLNPSITLTAVSQTDEASIIIHPTTDVDAFKAAVNSTVKLDGVDDDPAPALDTCSRLLHSHTGSKTIILVADGRDARPTRVRRLSSELRRDGVSILAAQFLEFVRLDDMAVPHLLSQITSRARFLLSKLVDEFPLPETVDRMTRLICGSHDLPPTFTPSPSPVMCNLEKVCFTSAFAQKRTMLMKDRVRGSFITMASTLGGLNKNVEYSANFARHAIHMTSNLTAFIQELDSILDTVQQFYTIPESLTFCRGKVGTSGKRVVILFADPKEFEPLRAQSMAIVRDVESEGTAVIIVGIGATAKKTLGRLTADPSRFIHAMFSRDIEGSLGRVVATACASSLIR